MFKGCGPLPIFVYKFPTRINEKCTMPAEQMSGERHKRHPIYRQFIKECACSTRTLLVYNITIRTKLVSTTMVGVDRLFGGVFMNTARQWVKLPLIITEKEAGWGCSPTSLIGGKPCNERLKKLPLDWVEVGGLGRGWRHRLVLGASRLLFMLLRGWVKWRVS